ncbi:breast cancer protein [Drepanopeziza brunnea f. sp. 'multigermtubi' MB_m1]|uniref:Inclusion body clearance protein IML2 n=1 Tax=Marssonina brunnea f. sp. multigermtubi (strain MB_m1) TaxID=1072389 RepID=K1XTE5_MARBU|nr:breast cancer protein [Drepanopeziza brunnea f. sp. 'multigermtubi' MB_m1]EKD15804.1 breast cancer protein [Drepanopeziza brunnea f. sp. 'multigermtubi' MB_m1]
MSRWFRSATKGTAPMVAEEEDRHLLQVEQALLRLLNDDIVEADKLLKQQDSSYHHLGRGISSFISSMLAAEKEIMKEAAAVLQTAENKTWEDMKSAQRSPTAFQSQIYPPGTEYLLCYSNVQVSQLTSAICAVMSGSVTGAMGGFFKLRKTFMTLHGIMDIEAKYLQRRAASRRGSVASREDIGTQSAEDIANLAAGIDEASLQASSTKDQENSSIEAVGAPKESTHSAPLSPNGLTVGSLQLPDRVEGKLLDFDPKSVVVGFKGDRELGTRYLWQAARFDNFNSAIAGIVLLGYYNGLNGFCDILPTDEGSDEDLSGYPKARCHTLLADMRRRYPESKLWKMEEARMLSANRNLAGCIEILTQNLESKMKQIALINIFELSLSTMFSQQYEMCAKSWIQASEISTWSPTLYAYLAGVAYLESYRNVRVSDPAAAKALKEKATEFLRKAPPLAGKQKVMAQQLPFDSYITRKMQKWEERVKALKVDLVDAIGVSPLTEMVYFWGGMKKQDTVQLQQSLDCLAWSRTSHPDKFETDLDEKAIKAVLEACILRNLGKYAEARRVLETEVLGHDKNKFRGHLKDDWTCPSAHYEMAALAWAEKDLEGMDHNEKVLESQSWLTKTQQWPDSYVLDSRVSVKVSTSAFTIDRHKRVMGI